MLWDPTIVSTLLSICRGRMGSGFIVTWEPPSIGTLLLSGAAALLLAGFSACASHSLLYLFIGVSEPSEKLPKFILVEYLDDQLFLHYDSITRRDVPRTSWVRKAEQNDPQVWVWRTELSRSWEHYVEDNLWHQFNHSKGTHTWQWLGGCDLNADGNVEGYSQLAYDGSDFLSLDMQTLTWTAAHPRAQVTKRRWEADQEWTQDQKNFLEGTCIEWMKEFLDYGKETLLRKDAPQVKVTYKADYESMENLICRVDGFYPKDIHVVWMKDGEVWEQETIHGFVVPNSDGTYHTWISVKINPKDSGHFRCRVDHASLENPVDFDTEEPGSTSNLGLVIGCTLGPMLLIVVALLVYLRRRQSGYEAASRLHMHWMKKTPGEDQRCMISTHPCHLCACWSIPSRCRAILQCWKNNSEVLDTVRTHATVLWMDSGGIGDVLSSPQY